MGIGFFTSIMQQVALMVLISDMNIFTVALRWHEENFAFVKTQTEIFS